jgi:hypothetical protein
MNSARRVLPGILLSVVLLAPASLRASDAFSLDLGIHGGAVGAQGSSKSTLFAGGVEARFHLVWLLAAEARASYYTDTIDVNAASSIDVKNIPVQLSAMLYPIKLPGFGFYVLGGGTYNSLKIEGNGSLSGTGTGTTNGKWAAHAGAGVDFGFSKHFLLNADGRYVFLNVDPANLPSSYSSYKGDYWIVTGSLIWKVF